MVKLSIDDALRDELIARYIASEKKVDTLLDTIPNPYHREDEKYLTVLDTPEIFSGLSNLE